MAVDKMLVAFDESEGSKKALKTASELAAANPNAHIDLVYVVPIPMLNSDQMASFQSILDLMVSDGEDLLAAAANDMGDDVASRTDSVLMTGCYVETVDPVRHRNTHGVVAICDGAGSQAVAFGS